MTDVRISRLSQEILREGDPEVDVSRLSEEILRGGSPEVQVSRLSLEILRPAFQPIVVAIGTATETEVAQVVIAVKSGDTQTVGWGMPVGG